MTIEQREQQKRGTFKNTRAITKRVAYHYQVLVLKRNKENNTLAKIESDIKACENSIQENKEILTGGYGDSAKKSSEQKIIELKSQLSAYKKDRRNTKNRLGTAINNFDHFLMNSTNIPESKIKDHLRLISIEKNPFYK